MSLLKSISMLLARCIIMFTILSLVMGVALFCYYILSKGDLISALISLGFCFMLPLVAFTAKYLSKVLDDVENGR